MLIAAFGVAQKTTWPITLTTADGLPGEKVVLNYEYKSQVFNLEEPVSTLRFTVISTNTTDSLTSGSYDGYSAGWGPGFPFFTLSELTIYDANGEKVSYTASCNAVASNDGAGVAALSNNNLNDFLHTSYSYGDWPQAYHYVEVALSSELDAFSFRFNSRSNYDKNLITYLGITPGTEYFPYPEQGFQLGEQVTTVEALAEQGALFVLRGNSADYHHVSGTSLDRWYKGASFYHSPYGAAIDASSASLVQLIPDNDVENGYKVKWVNDSRYILKPELNNKGGVTGQLWGTNNELNAGTVQFALATDSAEMDGTFKLFVKDGQYVVSQNDRCRMEYSKYVDTIPGNYYWTIFKANLDAAGFAPQLQALIDDAEARIAFYGAGNSYDDGEYDVLADYLATAKALVANPDASASEVIALQNELKTLIAAYTAAMAFSYIDSITAIQELVDNEELPIYTAVPELNAYSSSDYQAMVASVATLTAVLESWKYLADVDAAVENVQALIAAFWASKVEKLQSFPLLMTTADGLPGTKQGYGGYVWESPLYTFDEKVETVRFTFFETNNNGNYSGYVFPTFGEIEMYDASGNKIPLTSDSFYSNSVYMVENGTGDKVGYPALCDGNVDTHFHGVWGKGQNPTYDANLTYSYLEITFPEAISSFKYVQYGRKNAANTPTKFSIGKGGVSYVPNDFVDLLQTAKAINIGIDPGAYSIKSEASQTLIAAIAAAEVATGAAKEAAYEQLQAAINGISAATVNPLEGGYFVIQAANPSSRVASGELAITTYYNDFEANSPNCTSEYSLHWDFMPVNYLDASDRFKFQLIPASDNAKVQAWLDAGTINADQAANAYFVRSYAIDEYAGTSKDGARSQDIGFTVNPEEPYIVRSRGTGVYDFWHPSHYNASFHIEGTSRDIVYWAGSDAASQWKLRRIVYNTSVAALENGEATLSETTVAMGEAVTLTIAPNAGYVVKSVTANGKDITATVTDNVCEFVVMEPVVFDVEFDVLPGDANGDGEISLADVVAVINYIMDKAPANFKVNAADLNGDAKIGIGDVVSIVNILLNSDYQAAPKAKRGVMAASSETLAVAGNDNGAVAIELDNNVAYTAIQMDVELPEGAEFASATLSERAAGHSVVWNKMNNGKVRVIAYSMGNAAITGNAGELVTMNITADEAVSGAISVDNVRVVTTDGQEMAINGCGSLIDINGTTGINAVDGAALKVYSAAGALVIESDKAFDASVYSINGKLVDVLNVATGKNIYTLPAGTYVVGGVKVIIK